MIYETGKLIAPDTVRISTPVDLADGDAIVTADGVIYRLTSTPLPWCDGMGTYGVMATVHTRAAGRPMTLVTDPDMARTCTQRAALCALGIAAAHLDAATLAAVVSAACRAAEQAGARQQERETVWCESHEGEHFERDDCRHPHYTDQRTRARMNANATH